jgi:hypothetical protein
VKFASFRARILRSRRRTGKATRRRIKRCIDPTCKTKPLTKRRSRPQVSVVFFGSTVTYDEYTHICWWRTLLSRQNFQQEISDHSLFDDMSAFLVLRFKSVLESFVEVSICCSASYHIFMSWQSGESPWTSPTRWSDLTSRSHLQVEGSNDHLPKSIWGH